MQNFDIIKKTEAKKPSEMNMSLANLTYNPIPSQKDLKDKLILQKIGKLV